MLQRLQLEDVSARYASAIAELRDFLARAGVPVRTAEALHAIPEKLRVDRAFHRDLTSHLWVLMEAGAEQTGTVLGVLAVAAAGPQLAADAGTEDAHALLRFVMAARRSLEDLPVEVAVSPDLALEAAPEESLLRGIPSPERASSEISATRPPAQAAVQDLPPFQARPLFSRRSLWSSAACILVALAVWLWLRRAPSEPSASAPIVSAPGTASLPVGSLPAGSNIVAPEPANPVPQPSSAVRLGRHTITSSATSPRPNAAPFPAVTRPEAANGNGTAAATIVAPVEETQRAPASTAGPVVRTSSGKLTPVPASTLSRRLGSPAMPAYAPTEDESVTRRHPRLLRRQPASSTLQENDDTLLAEVDPADAPSMPTPGRSAFTPRATSTGIVRPASLGTMAANVMYTPVPPYPAEASAARVQGEVRVQARIDPSGNVASARVISGPPLLRDAALNAVQHWRYKPYMASGRPSATSTVAVVDFELP